MFYRMYSDNVKDIVIREASDKVAQTTEYVDLVMKNVENMSEAIISNPSVQTQIDMDTMDDAVSLLNIRDIVNFMKNLIQSISGSESIRIYFDKSGILLTTNYGLISHMDNGTRHFYSGVHRLYDRAKWIDSKTEKVSVIGDDFITLVRPMYSSFTLNKVGVLLINLDKKIFENYLKVIGDSNNLIMDDKGRVIIGSANRSYSLGIQSSDLLDPVSTKGSGDYIVNVGGEDKLVVFNTSKLTGWKFASIIDIDESVGKVTRVKDYILLFLTANFISAIIIMFLLSRKMFSPVKKLISFMKRVENGDFYARIEDDRADEFGYIFKNFNSMVERIKYLFHELFEEKLLKKDAELKLMQSQINPHFLHNIFNNMNWLLELKRYDDLETMMDAVSRYYKTSLNFGDDFIFISDNAEQLKSYASIQMIRFRNKFDCIFQFEDEILKEKIPNFILQPLLENAICHGVEPSEKLCNIRVTGRKEEGTMVFEVEDDGCGIDGHKLEEIQGSLKEDNGRSEKGFALINVNKRIKLYYGEEYGLKISSIKGAGTKTTVVIPLPGKA